MKKTVLLFLIAVFIIPISSAFAQQDTVFYKWFLQKKTIIGTIDVEVFSGNFTEGTFFEVPASDLNSVDPAIAKYQSLYDALVGAKWGIEDGALSNNITLRIFVRELNTATGQYNTLGPNADTLFSYFEVQVTEHRPGGDSIYNIDQDFYFNDGYAATFTVPISLAFSNFLNIIGLGNLPLAQMVFAYYTGGAFSDSGIQTVLTDTTIGFRAIHFSKFGGGRGKMVTGEEEDYLEIIPEDFILAQNYPNPFNPTTTIKFSIPKTEEVSLKVYDSVGRLVAELVSGEKAAGTYTISFNAENLASGIYIYELNSGSVKLSRKMILVK